MRNILFALLLLICYSASAASFFPEERRDSILQQISGATLSGNKSNILSFGAKGDGKTDCRKAVAKAMKKARKQGGMHLAFPKGVWLMKGPIHLESNVTLEIQEDAVIRFDATPEYYLPMVKTSWEGTLLWNYSPFIYGYQLHDVAIIGKGTIDGNCANTFATWKSKQGKGKEISREQNHKEIAVDERKFGEGYYLRPQLIQFFDSKNITILDIFITNSPFWCIHLLQSENIICRGIRYDAKLINNDGIDPESSRNILIEDVHFNNGDDNVAIKSGRDNDGWRAKPTENVIIRNCHFKGLHAVVIGSEMSGGVKNIFVEDCDYAGYCKRGLYVKTNPDRGGYVKDIYMRNLKFDEVEDFIYVTSMYAGEGMGSTHFSEVGNLYFENIHCNKVRHNGIVLQGTVAKPLHDITFRNINIEQVPDALSMDYTEDIIFRDCHFGKKAGVPTTAK